MMGTLTKESVKAIDELAALLKEKNVAYEIKRCALAFGNHNQLVVYPNPDCKDRYYSAICHHGSYGYEFGLIEVYNFEDDPQGFLTPQAALDVILGWIEK